MVEGRPLDEQTELELALFLSLQEKEHADTVAAQTEEVGMSNASAADVPAAQPSTVEDVHTDTVHTEASMADLAGPMVARLFPDGVPGVSQAAEAAVAAAQQAESAASTAAAEAEMAVIQAESAATTAIAHAESAAASAIAEAETAAATAGAQAESAAALAAAQAAVAATAVAKHVQAAARVADAALNDQASSLRGTVLSVVDQVDRWFPSRLRQRTHTPRAEASSAPLAQRGQALGQEAPASSTDESHLEHQEEGDAVQQEEAELAEAAEQVQGAQGGSREGGTALSRIHSVSSDDSSFDLTEAQPPQVIGETMCAVLLTI